ncbi:GNAT family N-acetyltransferase [Lapillicoccus jejuensis]|uniref:Putative acetyltransferase n=1 Tax=Lapillicoccus jejuensis TaxID=402171 RepID=A0A542E155_9MICO|nr:GNAT family N-acetyltransferase [Lapillicoccus jejuensis]TQJ09081.1 putative acetyltransferase [Lapillicoccus jejuensis]
MTPVVRRLTADDADRAGALGQEAFGPWPAGTATPVVDADGRRPWGAFDGDVLLAKATARPYESWWHGTPVATTGIAGVAVAAEARGGGLLDALFAAVLAEAAEHGEVLSTLYPTAPGIYRRFGYETVTSLDEVELSVASLARVPAPAGVAVRRATLADVPTVRRLYDAWAACQHGPLRRSGPSFPATDEELLASATGLSLALDGDEPVGFALWQRGAGYDAAAVGLTVRDLVALTPEAAAALWRVAGSFASVSGAVRLRTSGSLASDPVRRVLPGSPGRLVDSRPYMLRVSDVAAALTLAARASGWSGRARLAVTGDPAGQDGTYVVTAGGAERTDGPADVVVHPRGLALAFAGVAAARTLREDGLVSGPGDDAVDAFVDGLAGRAPVHVRDYF